MLNLKSVSVGRARSPLSVREVDLSVERGERVGVLGSNNSGKSELLKGIAGLMRVASGEIELNGERVDGMPAFRIARKGIALVPAERNIFPDLTITENLTVGYGAAAATELLEQILAQFPILGERQRQRAGLLSGGEQQQLAIARALMMRPSDLLLDEPSIGLSPIALRGVYKQLDEITEVAIVIVEQIASMVLDRVDRASVMRSGEIVYEGEPKNLLDDQLLQGLYFGDSEGSS